MNKPRGEFVDLKNVFEPDPAVQSLLGLGRQQAQERSLPKRARQKLAKQRQRDAERGSRASYDLPEKLIQGIAAQAEMHGCTASGIAALAIERLLDEIDAGYVVVADFLEPIRSPRYTHRVKLRSDSG